MCPIDVLEQARLDARLTMVELWVRYFGVGGMCSAFEIEAILCGALVGCTLDRELLALALNERFQELGLDQAVPSPTD